MELLKLGASIVIDVVGMASYLIPGLAELSDMIYAPVSAVLIYALYGEAVFSVIGFVEELSIGFDWIPTATLTWVYVSFKD